MSDVLQLLQTLAGKPAASQWFREILSYIRLEITDTGEAFTVIRQGDRVEVTPGFLGEFLEYFSAAGWSFVSLEDLLVGVGARRIAVTLDDGYRDNAKYALPVFRRHRAPFTIPDSRFTIEKP